MPECWTVRQSVSSVLEQTTMPMPEPARCRNKATQFCTGMLQYRTEMPDASMPMPADCALMSVPCCAKNELFLWVKYIDGGIWRPREQQSPLPPPPFPPPVTWAFVRRGSIYEVFVFRILNLLTEKEADSKGLF
jgi:hypothetical protein